ncbi:uncharacterized protein LOC141854859 [Brevipalpus obovatus]|uniref:uncharacterized protein LOC141854859 n=1 Tax=Brevipalpus obovatus TaxID=246614 RepID=UPI003D9E3E5D
MRMFSFFIYFVTFCILNIFNTLGKPIPAQTLSEDDHGETLESLFRMIPKDIINKAIELAQEIANEIKEDASQILELIKKCIETCINIDELSIRSGHDLRTEKKNLTLPQVIARLPVVKQLVIMKRIIFLRDLKKELKEEVNLEEATISSSKKHHETGGTNRSQSDDGKKNHQEFEDPTTFKNHVIDDTVNVRKLTGDLTVVTTEEVKKAIVFFTKTGPKPLSTKPARLE